MNITLQSQPLILFLFISNGRENIQSSRVTIDYWLLQRDKRSTLHGRGVRNSRKKKKRREDGCFSLRGSVMLRPFAVLFTHTHSFFYPYLNLLVRFLQFYLQITTRRSCASTLLRSRLRIRDLCIRCCTTLPTASPETPTPTPTSVK